MLDAGAHMTVHVGADEGALLFVVEGQVEVQAGQESAKGGVDHTFLVPPAASPRTSTSRPWHLPACCEPSTGLGTGCSCDKTPQTQLPAQ